MNKNYKSLFLLTLNYRRKLKNKNKNIIKTISFDIRVLKFILHFKKKMFLINIL